MKKEVDFKLAMAPIMRMAPYVKAAWIENGSVTVMVDDNIETGETAKRLGNLMDKASDVIKFSRKKPLSLWWEMVRHAEPKTLESLRGIGIIYDPSGYVRLFKQMAENGSICESGKKAGLLFERANRHLDRSEHILMENVTSEIFHAMTESAQGLLLFLGKYAPTPDDILKCLGDHRYGIDHKFYMSYKDITDEFRKIKEGNAEGFTPKEAGALMMHAKSFIFEIEDTVVRLERDRSEKMMHDAYNFCMRQCETALGEHMGVLPMSDSDKMDEFKRHRVDSGRMDPVHYATFKALHDFNHADRKAKMMLMGDRALDRARVKNLSLAMQDMTRA